MIETLKFSLEMGADEAIEDTPLDRYAAVKNKPATVVNKSPDIEPKSIAKRIESPFNIALNTKDLAANCKNLTELEAVVRNFKGISITRTATNPVFADGNPESEIMMIGEAPGAEEDAQGIPFCGASGKMLDQIFSYIGVSRTKNCYITNTLFWRPPGNRRPTPEELAICLPFVEKHIALINPKLIILVGGTAVSALLGDNKGITKLRGQFFDYKNEYLTAPIKTTAIFHPSYLLRSPGQKKYAWHDALTIQKYIADNNIKVTS